MVEVGVAKHLTFFAVAAHEIGTGHRHRFMALFPPKVSSMENN
jgi:hypothetical protein